MLEVLVAKLKIRPGPVRPEMAQVRADQVRPAVDELGGQAEMVERLVPELLLCLRAEDPVADTWQRGRHHQRPDQIGPLPGHGLGDPAADVITGEHRPAEPQFPDQRDDAACLRGRGVLAARLGRVPVRLAEPRRSGTTASIATTTRGTTAR
jgi:hypothetical protein